MKKKKPVDTQKIKFQFNTDLQEKILKFTAVDLNGWQALSLYDENYFDLLEHQTIAHCFKTFYRKKKKVPSKVFMKEELRRYFLTRAGKESYTDTDRSRILKLTDKIYKGVSQDGDDILDEVVKFAQYTKLRENIEKVDINDYSKYESFAKDIQKSITIGREYSEDIGTFLVKDIRKRQIDRQIRDSIYPFPFWQLNRITNGGGYYRNSVFVVLDKPKGFKTGFLASMARSYMRLKKRVVVFDLENGEEPYALRFEQALANKSKREILSGDYDNSVQKIMRKYKRLGVEVVIKRLPAFSTTLTMQKWIDLYYREYGIKFDECIIDYMALMGSIGNHEDDNTRISNAYLDVKNFAQQNNFEHVWTAHHVVRDAYKRKKTKYQADDTAKCIDIHRHVDGMFGLQQSDDEVNGGVFRLEVIDQRDGPPIGKVLLWGNEETQRLTEFTHKEVDAYNEQQGEQSEQINEDDRKARKAEYKKRVDDLQ